MACLEILFCTICIIFKMYIRDNRHMTSMKFVQFSRLSIPLSSYVKNSSTLFTFDVQFQTIPLSPLSKW